MPGDSECTNMAEQLKVDNPGISLVPTWIFVAPPGLRQTPRGEFESTSKISPVRAPIPCFFGNRGRNSLKSDINSLKYNQFYVGKHETLFGRIWTAKREGKRVFACP